MVDGIPARSPFVLTQSNGGQGGAPITQDNPTTVFSAGGGDTVVINNQFNLFTQGADTGEVEVPGASEDPNAGETSPTGTEPEGELPTDPEAIEYFKALRTAMEDYKNTGNTAGLEGLVPDEALRQDVIAKADKEKFYESNESVQGRIDELAANASPEFKAKLLELEQHEPESPETQQIVAQLTEMAGDDQNLIAATQLAQLKPLNAVRQTLEDSLPNLSPEEATNVQLRMMAIDETRSQFIDSAEEIAPYNEEPCDEYPTDQTYAVSTGGQLPATPGAQGNPTVNPFFFFGFGFTSQPPEVA